MTGRIAMTVGPVTAGTFCTMVVAATETGTPEVTAGVVVATGTALVTVVSGESVSVVAGVVLVPLTSDNKAGEGFTMIWREEGG